MPAPDNIYQNDVDFTALALQYPDFAKKLKSNRQLDFTDPESVRQLSLSLLHRDFSLNLHLPPDRLCPPIPNRFTYILHLQRLIDSTSPTYTSGYDPTRSVIGLDIGCGASCIYPLLACTQREKWFMLATEINEESRAVAQSNVEGNGVGKRIKIIDTDASSKKLIPVREVERFEHIDFLMTNPPFYASSAQMAASAKAKSRPPNSACTGAPVEMIYPYDPSRPPMIPGNDPQAKLNPHKPQAPAQTESLSLPSVEGGEVAFGTQLLTESQQPSLKHKITWFTAMLGHLSSLSTLITRIRFAGCTNYVVWEFVNGGKSKTRRWGVGWSWRGLRPSNAVARGVSALEKRLLPVATEVEFEVEAVWHRDGDTALRRFGERVDEMVCGLEDEGDEDAGVKWAWREKQLQGVGVCWRGDCWSRKARRRKELKARGKGRDEEMKDADSENEGEDDESTKEPALAFKISLRLSREVIDDEEAGGMAWDEAQFVVVHVRWLQGQDAVLFESFYGWLKRKLGD